MVYGRWWMVWGADLVLLGCVCLAGSTRDVRADEAKPRLLVLTDIGGDPDDQQSMIRLMLYSNELEIEGLIASASGTPGELKKAVTQPHLIREIVEAYGRVRPNLTRHARGYPPAGRLLARIKSGNPRRGLDAIGEDHDTEGSRWIIQTVDRPDPRPLHITIWGGQTDLAQALWRVRADRGKPGLQKFMARIRVFDIADQDDIHDWLFEQFPDLFYVLSKAPPGEDKRTGAFRGMYLGGDESLTSRAWVDGHIRVGHGPLGALYPEKTWTAPNPHGVLKEGDTPSWFSVLPNGLSATEHPEWGGWGGRYVHQSAGLYRDAHDTVGDTTDARCTVWRWRPAFQNDLAARMDWCVAETFDDANHRPIAVLQGQPGLAPIHVQTTAGSRVRLSAVSSSDPDGDQLDYRWFVYPEAGSWPGKIVLDSSQSATCTFQAPEVTKAQTVHVILCVTDDGAPPLSAFRRAVVTIAP